jgi:WD40 repeat protein
LQDKAQQKIARLVWTTDGKQLIVEGDAESRRLEVWNADKFERMGALDDLPEKGHRVSPDGRWVVTAGGGKVKIGDLTQKNKTILSWDDNTSAWLPAWSHDSRRLALKKGFDVLALEIPSGKQLTNVRGVGGSHLIAWSGDGQALAGKLSQMHRNQTVVRVWDLEADKEKAALFVGIDENLLGLAWSPQAPLLAGATEHSLYVWDVKQSRLSWRLVQLWGGKAAMLGEDGSVWWADSGAEDELLYVVELPDGTLRLLTPAEFRAQHPPRE